MHWDCLASRPSNHTHEREQHTTGYDLDTRSVTRRNLALVFVAAATAGFALAPDERTRPAKQPIDRQSMAPVSDAAQADATTPDPFAAVIPAPSAAEAAFRADAQGSETFRIKGPAQPRRSHDISDPFPVIGTGRAVGPDIVQIGEPLDADAPVAEYYSASEPVPIEIGRTLDANETDVWSLPRTSAEVIEIGAQLDADLPCPNQNQEREPVEIGPPIETEGLGTLL